MIKVDQVSFSFPNNPDNRIFDKINLEIPEKRIINIVGPGGSGKTTLAKLLAGLILPSNGHILIDNLHTKETKDQRTIRQKLAYIGQNPGYHTFATTVEELVAFAPENFGCSRKEIVSRVDRSLKITGLEDFRSYPLHSLPKGKQQITVLASFLSLLPKYLIFDESTSLLDQEEEKDFWEILKKVSTEHGIGIIYFSNEPLSLTCDIFNLKNKKVVHTSPDTLSLSPPINIELNQIRSNSSPAIKVDNLVYSVKEGFFGKERILLDNINLAVQSGELVFIYGKTQSGKTTLARILGRFMKPVSGEVTFPSFSKPLDKNTFRQKVGVVFQEAENQLLTETVEEEINLGLKNFSVPEKEREKRTSFVFDILSLDHSQLKDQLLFNFPLAIKRKIALSSVMVNFPDILILDEILAGLENKEKEIILRSLIQYQKEKNSSTIIFTNREIDMKWGHRAFLLEGGKLIKA